MRYPVIIHHDENSAYGVTVPDIPGCFSAGDTLGEALINTQEAIDGHLSILVEDGEDVPQATSVDNYLDIAEEKGAFLALVDIDMFPYLGTAKKINITIPHRLLCKIDSEVESNKALYKTRSGFFSKLAIKELKID